MIITSFLTWLAVRFAPSDSQTNINSLIITQFFKLRVLQWATELTVSLFRHAVKASVAGLMFLDLGCIRCGIPVSQSMIVFKRAPRCWSHVMCLCQVWVYLSKQWIEHNLYKSEVICGAWLKWKCCGWSWIWLICRDSFFKQKVRSHLSIFSC